ncbi:hypothetical protein ASF40_20715 [Microbacterium sp. Leaf288]|uniref:aldose 1-epimerase family protein n=1 Tax=Microbacterium sp. Leaf288 TaxID=1736323 RepID=UPI0006FE0F45|nr:aldose 1-epimerase family protein [Microbacterium sp. Leaf288]KQP72500.1 hypothetical protein ASF40_20715 [Microbacterium sp. Leaf288]
MTGWISGGQIELRSEAYVARIATVGASLRQLRFRDRDLIVPFDTDELRPAMRGAVLAPWPNRTAAGRYGFGGAVHQLPVNEVDFGNASHGLVAWTGFDIARSGPDSALLTATIEPQPGYPWRLRVDVSFDLFSDGLHQRIVATNLAAEAAPFGAGSHPYLVAGLPRERAIDEWTLHLPAGKVMLTSVDRLLPTGLTDVADQGCDFRSPRIIGGAVLNNAFTDLVRDEAGRARVRLVDSAGVGAEVELDETCPWVQLYTADAAAGSAHRHALAVEPMTCPPDALNSKIDLRVIPAGESTSVRWVIRAVA